MTASANQTPDPSDPLEDLVAEALALLDGGDDAALQQFLDRHPLHKSRIRAVIDRFTATGILGRDAHRVQLPERLGEFRMIRQIGGGGMGMVFEAEQQSLGRRVALKVIRPELLFFDGARERFRREVEAIARLSHPGVVPIVACGEHEQVPFFAMELLPGLSADAVTRRLRGRAAGDLAGRDLAAMLDAPPTTSAFAGSWWQTCVALLRQAAEAMAHAHERGIVHRDLKPSNLMLTPDGRAIVLDFGLAHVRSDDKITKTGGEPGSPAFMSPEQVRGEASDERADVYSLAATGWQLLARRAPFPVDDREVLRQRILTGDCPPVHEVDPTVPRDLGIVLRVAMDVDRERRYASMTAFAADLAAVADGRTIAARPTPWPVRLRRLAARHRVAAAALTTAALVALMLPIFWWQNGRTALHAATVEQARTERQLAAVFDAIDGLADQTEELRAAGPDAATMATALQRRALEFWQQIRAEVPESPRLRERLATARTGVIGGLLVAGERQQAAALAADALRDTAPDPRSPLRARALADAARVALADGRAPEAIPGFRAALAIARDLAPGDPTPDDLAARLWWLHDLTDAALATGDLAAAVESVEAELALLATTPALTAGHRQVQIGRALCQRADLASRQGDAVAAIATWRRALEHGLPEATTAAEFGRAAADVVELTIRAERGLLAALPAAEAAARRTQWRDRLRQQAEARPLDVLVHTTLAGVLVADVAEAAAVDAFGPAVTLAGEVSRCLLRIESLTTPATALAHELASTLTRIAEDTLADERSDLAADALRLLVDLPAAATFAESGAELLLRCAEVANDDSLRIEALDALMRAAGRGVPMDASRLRQRFAALVDRPQFTMLLTAIADGGSR
ncbi:MAG: serine/threonine protein kinase [Planctomycetes bacterium]|nr:serine/threonine protein kinase [Planctomycetota bacterium]